MERDDLHREISRSQGRLNGRYYYDDMGRWVQQQAGLANQQNTVQIDRTFTYIYSEPGSYEPLAQCYKEDENAQHTVNYFHCDQIGIPREMTDSDGKLIWEGSYDAWGSLIRDSYRETASDSHQPFRLQNQYFDEETGLHYNFFRYYEPVLGRFITQDPIGLAGGDNLYRFEGTVQNQVDVLGLKEGSPANLARRQKIDQIARGYNNSKAWCFDCKKDNFGVGTNKCNKYVYDVTKEAGATGEITIKGTKRAPLAAEWADKNTKIKNWRVLKDGETPLPGDVAAYKLEGGGASFSWHTGLMISNGSEGLTNISAHGDAVYPTPNQFESNPSTVYRRYTGE